MIIESFYSMITKKYMIHNFKCDFINISDIIRVNKDINSHVLE